MTAVLHLLAGSNGAGKSTLVDRVLQPATGLPFINANVIAAREWPGAEEVHAYEAAKMANRERDAMLRQRKSFITETVFSHPSKIDLVKGASVLKYQVTLHVLMIPLSVSLARVAERVSLGGHSVPEEKIVARYDRLWGYIAEARKIADTTKVYDNSSARHPFRLTAEYSHGSLAFETRWPAWAPAALR